MKLLISIGANVVYKKGDRVIINAGTIRKPEYYTSTITTVRNGNWYIVFDDGDKGSVDSIKDIVGKCNNRKRKTSFDKTDISKYLVPNLIAKSPKKERKLAPLTVKPKNTKVEVPKQVPKQRKRTTPKRHETTVPDIPANRREGFLR